MTTAELTQWEVARGRLDATIAEQAKTIARLRNGLRILQFCKLEPDIKAIVDKALEDTHD